MAIQPIKVLFGMVKIKMEKSFRQVFISSCSDQTKLIEK